MEYIRHHGASSQTEWGQQCVQSNEGYRGEQGGINDKRFLNLVLFHLLHWHGSYDEKTTLCGKRDCADTSANTPVADTGEIDKPGAVCAPHAAASGGPDMTQSQPATHLCEHENATTKRSCVLHETSRDLKAMNCMLENITRVPNNCIHCNNSVANANAQRRHRMNQPFSAWILSLKTETLMSQLISVEICSLSWRG